MAKHPPGPAMTLGNMRGMGVHGFVALPLSVPPSALPIRTLASMAGALAASATILVKKPGAA
jgi:hypothetical protein